MTGLVKNILYYSVWLFMAASAAVLPMCRPAIVLAGDVDSNGAIAARNPFLPEDIKPAGSSTEKETAVIGPSNATCYSIDANEKVVVSVYVSPAISATSRAAGEAASPVQHSYDEDRGKLSGFERILDKEKALKGRMIHEIEVLMRERNDLETELVKQEAFVLELQRKRDDLKKVLRLLEMRE